MLLAVSIVIACAVVEGLWPDPLGWPFGNTAAMVIRLMLQFGAVMCVAIGAIPRDRAYAFAATKKIGRARAQVAKRLLEGAGAAAWDEVRAGSASEVGLGWLRYKLIGWEFTHIGRLNGTMRVMIAGGLAISIATGVNSRFSQQVQSAGWMHGVAICLLLLACLAYWALAGPLWRLSLARTCDGRRLRGQCPHCGYDLSGATPRQPAGAIVVGPEQCSECGCPWPLVPSERDEPAR